MHLNVFKGMRQLCRDDKQFICHQPRFPGEFSVEGDYGCQYDEIS